jgi:uncharacterized lipoprotein YajG
MNVENQVHNSWTRVLPMILAVLLLLSSTLLTSCSEEPNTRIVVYPVPNEQTSSSHTTCVGGFNFCS